MDETIEAFLVLECYPDTVNAGIVRKTAGFCIATVRTKVEQEVVIIISNLS